MPRAKRHASIVFDVGVPHSLWSPASTTREFYSVDHAAEVSEDAVPSSVNDPAANLRDNQQNHRLTGLQRFLGTHERAVAGDVEAVPLRLPKLHTRNR
jgi:hypothetical protein